MNVYSVPKQLHTVTDTPRIIALGVFDGVHIGHRAVLTNALLHPTLSPAVFTFHGIAQVKTGGILQTNEDQRCLFDRLGFSDVFEADFAAIRDLSPVEFVTFLCEKLSAKAIVCGFNFRFGKYGAGDTALLQELCEKNGITLHIVPAVTVDGDAVSSTRIRHALANGNVRLVTRLLATPFTIHTVVKNGKKLGRTLGTPTINQPLDAAMAKPRFGVYASLAIIDNKALPAVTNIGTCPTVNGTSPIAETFILGFDGELYGKTIPVQLIEFLRDEQKFSSVEQLKAQIEADVASATAVFTPNGAPRAILFDFDDTLQDRDAAMTAFIHIWLRKEFPCMQEADVVTHGDRIIAAGKHGFLPYAALLHEAERIFPEHQFDQQEFLRLLSILFPANTVLFPDAVETLQHLRSKGYLLGMLTNGFSAIQNRKIDVSGLRPLFDYILISGDDNLQKPNVEAFRRVALRLGVHPADCVYVGDNPENDVKGALDAGMQAVFRVSDFDDFFSFSYDNIMDNDAPVIKLSADEILAGRDVPRIRCLSELENMY